MFCPQCKANISPEARTCPQCGHPIMDANASSKSRLAALLLCFFCGFLGIHRFYVGKIGTGIIQLLTFGGLGIWSLIDFIMICCGSFKDSNNRPVTIWNN